MKFTFYRPLAAILVSVLFLLIGCGMPSYTEQEVMDLLPGYWSVQEEPIMASEDEFGWEGEILSRSNFSTFNSDGSGWYEGEIMLVAYDAGADEDLFNQWLSLEYGFTWWYEDGGIYLHTNPGSFFSYDSNDLWDDLVAEMNASTTPPDFYEVIHLSESSYQLMSEPDDYGDASISIGVREDDYYY